MKNAMTRDIEDRGEVNFPFWITLGTSATLIVLLLIGGGLLYSRQSDRLAKSEDQLARLQESQKIRDTNEQTLNRNLVAAQEKYRTLEGSLKKLNAAMQAEMLSRNRAEKDATDLRVQVEVLKKAVAVKPKQRELVAPKPRPVVKEIEVDRLLPDNFELGQVGMFHDGGGGQFFRLKVTEIPDAQTLVLYLPGQASSPFLLTGRSTAGLAEGRMVNLTGKWKVVDTRKYRSRTYYVVEPVNDTSKIVTARID